MSLDDSHLEKLTLHAVEAAEKAGQLLLNAFQSKDVRIDEKSVSDLVTQYDVKSEALLTETLKHYPVIGEEGEGKASLETRIAANETFWVVDPIDGTSNFAHGHPYFAVSIALVVGHEPVVGVTHAPMLGRTYFANKASETKLSCKVRNSIQSCRVSTVNTLSSALLSTGFPPHRRTSEDNNYARFMSLDSKSHGVRRAGAAAIDLALVAEGAYEGFWELGLKAWDVAAGSLLVKQAGGKTTTTRGESLSLTGGNCMSSNGAIHDLLLEEFTRTPELPPGLALVGGAWVR